MGLEEGGGGRQKRREGEGEGTGKEGRRERGVRERR